MFYFNVVEFVEKGDIEECKNQIDNKLSNIQLYINMKIKYEYQSLPFFVHAFVTYTKLQSAATMKMTLN